MMMRSFRPKKCLVLLSTAPRRASEELRRSRLPLPPPPELAFLRKRGGGGGSYCKGRSAVVEGGRGGTCLFACLSHSIINHASFSRRNTVPTPTRGTSNIWALSTCLSFIALFFCISYLLPVWSTSEFHRPAKHYLHPNGEGGDTAGAGRL